MSPLEDVVVVANPYEGERLRRLLEASGRQVTLLDGGPRTDEELDARTRALVVLSRRLTGGDPAALLLRLLEQGRPLVLIGDEAEGVPEGVPRVARPVEAARLEDALLRARQARPLPMQRPHRGAPEHTPSVLLQPAPTFASALAATAPLPQSGDLRAIDPARTVRLSTTAPLPQSGDLRTIDPPTLIGRLWREGFTGRVRLRRGDIEKTVHLDEGYPVCAASNLPADRLGDQLLREGRITRWQYDDASRLVAETGRRMGAVLLDLGALRPADLFGAVRRHYETVLLSLFAWDDGTYVLDGEQPPAAECVRLEAHLAALVLDGVRRKYGPDRLLKRLGGDAVVLRRTGDGMLTAWRSRCRARAAALSRRNTTLDETAVIGLASPKIRARVDDAGLALARRTKARRRPRAAPTAAHRRAHVGRRDTSRSGIHAGAGGANTARCALLRRAITPRRAVQPQDAETSAQVDTIREVLDEAWLVLGNDARREAYRRAVEEEIEEE